MIEADVWVPPFSAPPPPGTVILLGPLMKSVLSSDPRDTAPEPIALPRNSVDFIRTCPALSRAGVPSGSITGSLVRWTTSVVPGSTLWLEGPWQPLMAAQKKTTAPTTRAKRARRVHVFTVRLVMPLVYTQNGEEKLRVMWSFFGVCGVHMAWFFWVGCFLSVVSFFLSYSTYLIHIFTIRQ